MGQKCAACIEASKENIQHYRNLDVYLPDKMTTLNTHITAVRNNVNTQLDLLNADIHHNSELAKQCLASGDEQQAKVHLLRVRDLNADRVLSQSQLRTAEVTRQRLFSTKINTALTSIQREAGIVLQKTDFKAAEKAADNFADLSEEAHDTMVAVNDSTDRLASLNRSFVESSVLDSDVSADLEALKASMGLNSGNKKIKTVVVSEPMEPVVQTVQRPKKTVEKTRKQKGDATVLLLNDD